MASGMQAHTADRASGDGRVREIGQTATMQRDIGRYRRTKGLFAAEGPCGHWVLRQSNLVTDNTCPACQVKSEGD
ncbi:hypothetical protein BTO32_09725 [Marinobacter lutaoensis]|uniref:Uncharacterized protein n=1 Tax=Marinobacter lutaoensis TaxID=135739 RepID=A0A1V2DRL1_9GAMM|nr:hypothetical protein BTO32_09725 [Marinobacter lutaoensis]